jgi:hypothetical protein
MATIGRRRASAVECGKPGIREPDSVFTRRIQRFALQHELFAPELRRAAQRIRLLSPPPIPDAARDEGLAMRANALSL